MTTLSVPTLLEPALERAPDRARARRRAAVWALVAFCALSATVGRLTYLLKPFDHDARMFIYLGKLVDDGGRYCHDLIDNKFPSVGLMTSVAWRAFGTHWWAYVVLQAAMALACALLLARSAARSFGEHARLPTLLYALVYLNLNVAVFGGFQLETLQIFFATLAAGAALEALRGGRAIDAFVVGLAGGCAVMLKPTGASVIAAFAIATCVARAREPMKILAHGAAGACGFAVPAIVTLLYLVQTDILGDMPALYRQISRYANETPWELLDAAKILVVATIGGFPLLVRGWVFRREPDRVDDAKLGRALVIFVIGWTVIELLGAVMQRRMYAYHFLVVAAPASVLFGMLPRRDRAAPLAAALIPAAVLSMMSARVVFQEVYPPQYRMPVSDYIAARTTPSDAVWQDSVPRLLLETGCRPGSKIPLTFLFFNYDTAPIEYTDVLLSDFAERRPKYIVLPTDVEGKIAAEFGRSPEMEAKRVRQQNYFDAWLRIERYVKSNYDSETTIGRETVYRRRD